MTPDEIIEKAVCLYDPSHIYGLMSGGHDSLCATHIAAANRRFADRFSGVVHINTGIGIEETRQYVRDTCKAFGWSLKELTAQDYKPGEQTYEELVVERGFPGPAMHWKMYHRLKERALRALVRDTGNRKRKIMLVSGRRRAESTRRMVNVDEVIKTGQAAPSPRIVWANPIADWESIDKHKYMSKHNLPRNEVVERLCMSGECLCGAFAKPGELEVIRAHYPAAAEEIDRIAAKAKEAGVPCVWGRRPGESIPDLQPDEQTMCSSCWANAEASDDRRV